MESISAATPTIAPGMPLGGGFYAGPVKVAGQVYALVVAPKATGETKGAWHKDYADVPGARHYDDGLANTRAMAEAGCPLAAWALSLEIDGARGQAADAARKSKGKTDECGRAAAGGSDSPRGDPPAYRCPKTLDMLEAAS